MGNTVPGSGGVTRCPAFSAHDVQACATTITIPTLPELYERPRPYHPTSNGGPPIEGRKAGRPSVSTDDLRDAIVDRLADGAPMRAICMTSGFPSAMTVRRWRKADPAFDRVCELASEEGRIHIVQTVSALREEVIKQYPPKVARKWWLQVRQRLLRLNPRFFGHGPR
jgi:transposase